eukprot:82214-Pelagomonas_calceolata.AAC.2
MAAGRSRKSAPPYPPATCVRRANEIYSMPSKKGCTVEWLQGTRAGVRHHTRPPPFSDVPASVEQIMLVEEGCIVERQEGSHATVHHHTCHLKMRRCRNM